MHIVQLKMHDRKRKKRRKPPFFRIKSIKNFDRDFFTFSLGNCTHKNANLFNDLALAADDFAHISVCNANFINGFAAVDSFSLCHNNLIRMIDKVLHDIGE